MNPYFRSLSLPSGLHTSMAECAHDSSNSADSSPGTRVDGNLREHIELNMRRFLRMFPGYKSNRETHFLVRDLAVSSSVLFASYVRSYRVTIPQLYREDGIVRDVTERALFAKLAEIPSLVPQIVYEDVLEDYVDQCRLKLRLRTADEKDLVRQITILIRDTYEFVNKAAHQDLTDKFEALSGASGVLCVQSPSGGLEHDSGFAGFCDVLYKYGTGAKKGKVFCTMEFKHTDTRGTEEIPYYRLGEALFAQNFESLIGHRARFGIALTIHGLKVVVMERNEDTAEIRFFKWPPGDEFFQYRQAQNLHITAKLFMHIARVGLTEIDADSDLDSDLEVQVKENSTPKRPRLRREPLSDKKIKSAREARTEAAGDTELWASEENLGQRLYFRSIDVNHYFPDVEQLKKEFDFVADLDLMPSVSV